MSLDGVSTVFNVALDLFQDIAQCPVWDIFLPLFVTVGLSCLFWQVFRLGKGVS